MRKTWKIGESECVVTDRDDSAWFASASRRIGNTRINAHHVDGYIKPNIEEAEQASEEMARLLNTIQS